jgi:hypothetical protein
MNRSNQTREQLLLEIEELGMKLDVAQHRLQEANEQTTSLEEDLKECPKFETLLAELSARFVNLPSNRIESEIEES